MLSEFERGRIRGQSQTVDEIEKLKDRIAAMQCAFDLIQSAAHRFTTKDDNLKVAKPPMPFEEQ